MGKKIFNNFTLIFFLSKPMENPTKIELNCLKMLMGVLQQKERNGNS